MVSLGMNGPYPLTKEDVDQRIPVGSIGNYAYGYKNIDGIFIVKYVGRSDNDLNDRVKHGIGQYKLYKFCIAKNSKEAYEKECKNYHDFGGMEGILDNDIHPDKPDNTDYECPYCNNWEIDV